MKTVASITNAGRNSGVGSRAYELAVRMQSNTDFEVSQIMLDGTNNSLIKWPGMFGSKSIAWIRLARGIGSYDLYDITNQSLSFIAKRKKPSIVTVHDIIELTNPQDRRASLLHKYLLSGITHANKIVSVSEYTKQMLIRHLNIPATNIIVIPNGISQNFHSIPDFTSTIGYKELEVELGLTDRRPVVLFVGSEHPRKNIQTALRTIALLKKKYPEILLLKIGDSGIPAGRKTTLETIDTLGIQHNVKLLGMVSSERLNELYNVADALLFPSTLEGFGLTPLEAMAAGCPVVSSNATSIPEVVGDAGLMYESDDAEGYADGIIQLLSDDVLRNQMITKGHERTMLFSWDTSAQQMIQLYKSML